MITNLSIRNFALIENCELEFSPNLNVITGETGAGKSILIEALSILLGNRASTEQIRTGMEEATLSATIIIGDIPEIQDFLNKQNIFMENNEILLRRHLLISGKSRSFINGIQVTSKELNYISSILFDFHGQHEGISLLKRESHIKYFDNYLKIEEKVNEINRLYEKIQWLKREISLLDEDVHLTEKQMELLKYEIEEIEDTNFMENEDIELAEKIKRVSNIEKIATLANEIAEVLGGENGAVSSLKLVRNLVSQASELDSSFMQDETTLADLFYKLEDFYSELNNKISKYQYNQMTLDELITRNELLEKMKRKYGGSFESIQAYLKKAKQDLLSKNNQKEVKQNLEQELKIFLEKYTQLAVEISSIRKKNKEILEGKVIEELKILGMNNAIFEIHIENDLDEFSPIEIKGKKYKMFSTGLDRIEYLLSTNKGEPLKPLAKIASGGELSRIILALKSILGRCDTIETMVFDEIDVGIGGKVALSVGKKIKALSMERQIICITHLAQIAACGNRNFLIHKETTKDRTISYIDRLEEKEKIREIARMLSGNVTENSTLHAEELIRNMK